MILKKLKDCRITDLEKRMKVLNDKVMVLAAERKDERICGTAGSFFCGGRQSVFEGIHEPESETKHDG